MQTVGAFEAKTHFSRLLELAEKGEHFTITRHGQPVAKLVGLAHRSPERVTKAVEAILELQQHVRLDGLLLRELIEEGRR